ncbi:hypothetical protein AAFC00_004509 [Neodothiora populina]|uniref:Uncharacterized protein n=1 Tax=Neodothiora populina TaxID=2781224 RepID=A0ABR3P2R6_9PEZI
MYYITQALHVPQALLSAYGLYLSYTSIQNLRQYEAQSEKAAEWSNTAAEQLHKTRTTQANAAITILLSFSTATVLTFVPHALPSTVRFVLSPALLVATLVARGHVSSFWSSKAKVPFVQGYNEAIGTTKDIVDVLKLLEYSWVGMSFLGAVVGY